MRFLFPHILFTGFVILSFLCNSAAAQEEQKKLVWPPPPEKARIEYLYSFSSKPDIGIEKSIWRKVWDFIIGLQDEEEKIIQPAGVAVLDDRIFVSDPGASCVHIFNPKEKSYSQLTDSYTGRFGWPIGIAVSSTGNIYVADAARKEIAVFDRNEKPIHSIKGLFERPTGITIKNNRLFVVDTPLHKILVFDLNGNFLYEFGHRGSGNGEFNFPVHISAGENLYVVDAMNHRVQVLNDTGRFINTFGRVGNVQGTFANPKGIAVDSDGHIYVTDVLFDAFQIFDSKGTLLLLVGRSGSGSGEFLFPSGLFIDQKDNIYVVDALNRRIQVFRYIK